MKVRYSYLQQQFADPEEILVEIRALLDSGAFTLGPQVEKFERSFASLIGAKHAIGVGSGTDAIKLALKSAGVGHGDEVITAANTFIATVGAINELGAKPVFVDATPNYTLNVKQIEEVITNKTKAIVPVHLTGEPADMDAVMKIAQKHMLAVVEDACQAILANCGGKNAGTMGVAGAFSLHPLKNLNVWGDAGVIVTDDSAFARKIQLLRNHGMRNRDEIETLGFNSRLDTIQAIVGNWLIKSTQSITEKRIANAAIYDTALSELNDKIRLAPRRKGVKRVFHLYMFEVDHKVRNQLVEHLLERGVDAKIHYPIPLYLQEGLRHLGYKRGDFPETDRQADEVVSIPVDQHLSLEQIDYTVKCIRDFFSK